ncbi:MAG: hypothetical protein ACLUDU_20870 [Butyricimonas faecihominis]
MTGIEKIVQHRKSYGRRTGTPATIYNIGHGTLSSLWTSSTCWKRTGKEAQRVCRDAAGRRLQTWADTTRLQEDYGYTRNIMKQGLSALPNGSNHITNDNNQQDQACTSARQGQPARS